MSAHRHFWRRLPKCPDVTGSCAAGACFGHLSEKPLHIKGSDEKASPKVILLAKSEMRAIYVEWTVENLMCQ